jgi:hypothetical protein
LISEVLTAVKVSTMFFWVPTFRRYVLPANGVTTQKKSAVGSCAV